MLVFRIALRNLVRRGRKTLAVGILIAAGVAGFFVGNAVLESSAGGIKSAFADNFTADLSVSARSDQSFSLFGPDIPIIGDSEAVPTIVNAAEAGRRVSRVPGVQSVAYVLTAPLLLEANAGRQAGLGLGVISGEYFSLFRAPRFIAGGPPEAEASNWAVVTDAWADEIAAARGAPLRIGEKIQLTRFTSETFAIRQVVVTGIIRYQPDNDALRRVVITDARVMRALCGFLQTDSGSGANTPAAAVAKDMTGSIDSLFSGPASHGSPSTSSTAPISMDELKDLLEEAHQAGTPAQEPALNHDGAWHFILVRTSPGASLRAVATDMRRQLSDVGTGLQVRDWRGTAGGVATYVFVMQIVLYVGMFFLAVIAVILTVNSVVLSVFERTPEIGTMRAVGAQKRFVRSLLLVETAALALVAGAVGVAGGIGLVAVLNRFPLRFHNQILVLLFGGASLHPVVSASNLLLSLLSAAVIGLAAWIYPVRVALGIQPVQAIHAH